MSSAVERRIGAWLLALAMLMIGSAGPAWAEQGKTLKTLSKRRMMPG